MIRGKFLNSLSNAYKQIFFEQEMPPAPPPAPPGVDPAMGAMPPMPGTQPIEKPAKVEEPVKKAGSPLTQEGNTILAGLLAKAFFIDIVDESEKYQIKNMQDNLNDENAGEIELEIVKRLELLDPQLLDVDENLFELTPAGAQLFINEIAKKKLIPSLEIKPGGGHSYMLNLIITALLRPTDLTVVKIEQILKKIKEKTEGKNLSGIAEQKTEVLFQQAFNKYAKI